MKHLIFFLIVFTSNSSIFSQKIYEKIGDYYYTTDNSNFLKGKSISNMNKIDSVFLVRGFEKYLEYDFGNPFVFSKGKAMFLSLTMHVSHKHIDSSFSHVVFASSKLLNINALSIGSFHETELNEVFAPHEFLYDGPILYGLGLDISGNPIALSVIDSTYTNYNFPCESESETLDVKSKKYTLNRPFNLKLAGEGQFKCITIWEEKIGIVGLVGGIHKVLFSPDGISILETYNSPKNIIRYWDSPFYPTHEITSEGH